MAFGFVDEYIWATSLQMGASSFVIEPSCARLVAFVKKQCEKFVSQIITKLQGHSQPIT